MSSFFSGYRYLVDENASGFISMNHSPVYVFSAESRPFATLHLYNINGQSCNVYFNTSVTSFGLYGSGYLSINNITFPSLGCMTIYSDGSAWRLISKTF